MILNSPLNSQQLSLESITTSESPSQPNLKPVITGPKSTDSNRIGDYWEHYVTLEAWSRGAEVFKNASSTGRTDLILKWNGMLLECDVKQQIQTGQDRRPGKGYAASRLNWERLTPYGITIISVHPFTREIRWVKGHEPEGWEHFWKT